MKVTIIETKIDEIKDEKFTPFVAKYGDNFVLILGKTIEGYDGIMLNDNGCYKPFEYRAANWRTNQINRFHGKIEIECP